MRAANASIVTTGRTLRRAAAAATLALLCGPALADGSGTINDTTLKVTYESLPYVVPNLTGESGEAVCEPGTPTCDVYLLTIELSDTWRADPANELSSIDMVFTWDANSDYDIFVYDAAGTQIASATNFVGAGGDAISLPAELMPNGTYSIQMVPYLPLGSTVALDASVTGLTEGSKGLLGGVGALAPALMLPLLGLAALRRRHRSL